MKYIIWDYNKSTYLNENGITLEYSTEKEAENIVKKLAFNDVESGKESTIEEAIENGYLIEEI